LLSLSLLRQQWPQAVGFGIGMAIFLFGIRLVHQEERFIIELLGGFWGIKGPGLIWIFPGLMKVREVVAIWEQTLNLFEDPIKIDFKDGSAVPKGVYALVRIKNPDTPYTVPNENKNDSKTGCYRVVYEVDNWRKKTIEVLENAVRSYLATLTIDEALPKRRGGYDLLTANRIPRKEKERIKNTLEKWGVHLLSVYVTDFDLDEDIVRAREEVQKKKRAAEAAEQEKKIRAQETVGSLIQMFAEITGREYREVQEEINNNPAMKERLSDFSKDLITRRMAIDGRAFTDIRVAGAQGIEKGLLEIFTLLKGLPKGREVKIGKNESEEAPYYPALEAERRKNEEKEREK